MNMSTSTTTTTSIMAPPTGLLGRDQEKMLAFLSNWWISIGTIASLLLQISLLITGGTRKWNRACRFIAWSSYNMSDFMATLVLGGLAQTAANSGKTIYAIWAPMLLLHLGAPDNISAYALEDAELWQRHGFTMLLQISSAAYVVANCATTWRYALVSLCLLAAGSIKSAERTLALRFASKSALKELALPVYEFMRLEPWFHGTNNEDQDSETIGEAGGTVISGGYTYNYLLAGEDRWHRNFLQLSNDGPEEEDDKLCREAAARTHQLVTLHNILRSEDLSQTPRVVLMCTGFALFKLYRRRLSSLYMYEWRHQHKTPQFFLGNQIFESREDILFVLDVELRFLFDSLYTKASGTAFTKLGVIFRIGTTILLVVSGIFLISPAMRLREQAKLVKEAPDITFFLLTAAIVIEAYQLIRIALSDWTKVWLAYTYIRLTEGIVERLSVKITRSGPGARARARVSPLREWLASCILEMIRMGDSIARHKYWNNRIGQYAMKGEVHVRAIGHVHTFQPSGMADKIWHPCHRVLLRLRPQYEYNPDTIDHFKRYVLRMVLRACEASKDAQVIMTISKTRIDQISHGMPEDHKACFGAALGVGYTDLEHVLVNWHVATCICELLDYPPNVNDYGSGFHGPMYGPMSPSHGPKADYATIREAYEFERDEHGAHVPLDRRMSKLLSRYMAYLLVHKTELLPCHAEIAKQLAMETQTALRRVVPWDRSNVSQLLCEVEGDRSNVSQQLLCEGEGEISKVPYRLQSGIQAAYHLQKIENVNERWWLIMRIWVEILIFAAAANKAPEQLQQLTLGGEFLTNIWVLLGHMGAGEK